MLKVHKVLLAVALPDLPNTAASPLTDEVAKGHGLANHVTGEGVTGERSTDQVHFHRGQSLGAPAR